MKTQFSIWAAAALGTMDVDAAPLATNKAIPFDQIGVAAGKQYTGDGLSIVRTTEGASLRCVFQRMEATDPQRFYRLRGP